MQPLPQSRWAVNSQSDNVSRSLECWTRQSHLAFQLRSDRGPSAPSSASLRLNAATHLVQLQRSASVLNGVMRGLLNVDAQQVGCQKAQAELALPLEVEQFDCINGLHRQIGDVSVTLQLVRAQEKSSCRKETK